MATPKRKSFTFISRSRPYGKDNAQACLDMVLASSVFEQSVTYLFIDDGVYQLVDDQQVDGIDSKNLLSSLAALDLYGIENVYVDAHSLQERDLTPANLAIKSTVIESSQVSKLIQDADVVFNL